jgi:hypothetical protein
VPTTSRPLRRVRHLTVLLLLLTSAAMLLTVSPSEAKPRDCFWGVPDDPDLINVAFPDTGAAYWGGMLRVLPGTEVEIRGRFPHARYMSLHVYDSLLRPTDALADVQIAPDAGSTNPFLVGADRTSEARDYTVRVVAEPPPASAADRAPNTLHLSAGEAGVPAAIVLYRVYVPDAGSDATGGTGLPEVVVTLPDGTELPGGEVCEVPEIASPPLVNDLIRDEGLPAVLNLDASDPVDWRKFVNFFRAQTYRGDDTPLEEPLAEIVPDDAEGGYLSNLHNAYTVAWVDRALGDVLVFEGRSPTFPRTSGGAEVMEAGQVRYWSICHNEERTTRYIDCLYDEQIVTDEDGDYVLVVSTAATRPRNATPECGVNWIAWGAFPSGVPILRHMLAAEDFTGAVQAVADPDDPGASMGQFLPTGTYTSVEEFEARDCESNAQGVSDPSTTTTPGADPDDEQPSTNDADAAEPVAAREPLPVTGAGSAVFGLALLALALVTSRATWPRSAHPGG